MATTKSTSDNGEQAVETTSLGVLQELEAIRARMAQIQAAQNEAKAKSQPTPSDLAVKDAENRQKIAEAEAAIAKARREQITGAIPDLSTMNTSTLETNADDPAIGEGLLTYRAIEQAAKQVAKKVAKKITEPYRVILVTNDEDLVAETADFQLVSAGLKSAIDYSKEVLKDVKNLSTSEMVTSVSTPEQPTEALSEEKSGEDTKEVAEDDVVGATLVPAIPSLLPQLGAAAATLIPPLVSMFSAKRTLRSGTGLAQDLAATAAVVGELEAMENEKVQIIHDRFRMINSGSKVLKSWVELSGLQDQLNQKKSSFTNWKEFIEAELNTDKEHLEEALKELDRDPEEEAAKRTVKRLKSEVNSLTSKALKLADALAKVDTALGTIGGLAEGLLTVHEGSQRNLLTTAALREELYASNENPHAISHIMLVNAQQLHWTQLIDDRPLWFADRFSSIVGASITYLLVQTRRQAPDQPRDQTVVSGGTSTAVVEAFGKIGHQIEIEDIAVVKPR